jgi:two-component system response regulator PilR (NtrC family)
MSGKPKILFIDDELDLLNLVSSFFAEEALPIDTCSTFAEALIKVRNGSYDLIITDARMPNGSGKEILSIARSEKLNCGKFILLTGNLDVQIENGKDKFDLILYKPLCLELLVDHAKKLLKI